MATPRPIEPMERTPTVAKGAGMIDSRRNVAAVAEGGLWCSQVDNDIPAVGLSILDSHFQWLF